MEEYQVMIQSREWLVGWGTLSLINAGLAQGKNRSGLIWWILSLIFGPLATLVLVLLSKAPAKIHD
ncbi:antitermination protein NusB [Microbulbifer sp. CAU 1566]|uniref:antitermination protein NusB n=1 Tax=Microbulbifer sp. CAU 1566 TaxID=2933269 RepID=UPI002002AC16|nr:antitermination protein NusB [Microbulbifer sp. CAU 1566]MCK7598947.1 antitermination protein NusB [Microbulbifer sp. CAU 1566]